MGAAARGLAVCLLMLLPAGCGGGEGRAKSRPAQLFRTPPAGFTYKLPDKATLSEVMSAVAAREGGRGDDIATRVVVRKGARAPTGFVVVLDAHSTAAAAGVARGFSNEARQQTGKTPRTTEVAGLDVTLADYQGLKLGATTSNGYAIAAVAQDEAGVRLLLARLIFAARAAKR